MEELAFIFRSNADAVVDDVIRDLARLEGAVQRAETQIGARGVRLGGMDPAELQRQLQPLRQIVDLRERLSRQAGVVSFVDPRSVAGVREATQRLQALRREMERISGRQLIPGFTAPDPLAVAHARGGEERGTQQAEVAAKQQRLRATQDAAGNAREFSAEEQAEFERGVALERRINEGKARRVGLGNLIYDIERRRLLEQTAIGAVEIRRGTLEEVLERQGYTALQVNKAQERLGRTVMGEQERFQRASERSERQALALAEAKTRQIQATLQAARTTELIAQIEAGQARRIDRAGTSAPVVRAARGADLRQELENLRGGAPAQLEFFARGQRVTDIDEISRLTARLRNTLRDELAAEERIAAQRMREAQRESTTQRRRTVGGAVEQRFAPEAMAGSIASYGRYLASAALLGGTLALLRDTRVEVINYVDSVTDLEIALRGADQASGTFIDTLSDIARLSGANPGEALDAAARGIRAFSDANAGLQQQEDVGEGVAMVATQIASIAQVDLKDATGDVIAIGTAFGITEQNLSQVVDAIAFARNEIGGSDIPQGIAAIAVAADEAGFSLDETANMISLVSARTDQSGRTIATRLGRVFQMIGGTAGQNFIARLNEQLGADAQIDVAAPIATQLAQIANAYNTLGEAQRGQIRNAFAGVSAGRELVPLLEEMPRLLEANARSAERAGEGQEQFNRIQDDLRSTLQRTAALVGQIQVELFETGAFDIFVGGLIAVENALSAVNTLLQLLNNVTPRWARSLALITAELLLLQRVLTAIAARDLFRGALGGLLGGGAGGAGRAAQTATRTATAAGGAMAGAGFEAIGEAAVSGLGFRLAAVGTQLVTTISGIIRGLWRFVASPLGGTTIAVLIGAALYDATNRVLDELDDAAQAMAEPLGRTPDEIEQAAQNLLTAAAELRASSGGIAGTITNWLQGDPVGRAATDLEERARRASAVADRVAEIQARAAEIDPSALIDITQPEGVAEGLKALEERGIDAEGQLDALFDAFGRLGSEAERTANRLSAAEQATASINLGAAIVDQLGGIQRQEEALGTDPSWMFNRSRTRGEAMESNRAADVLREALTEERELMLMNAIQREAQAYLEAQGGELTPDNIAGLQEIVSARVRATIPEIGDLPEALQEQIAGTVLVTVRQQLAAAAPGEEEKVLAWRELVAVGPQLAQRAGQIAETIGSLEGDLRGGALAGAERELGRLQEIRAFAVAGGAEDRDLLILDQAIREATLGVQERTIARIDAIASLNESLRAPSDVIGRTETRIRALEQQIEQTTDIDERRALRVQLNDLRNRQDQQIIEQANAERLASISPRDTRARAVAEIDNAEAELAAMVAAGDTESAAYWQLYDRIQQLKVELANQDIERAFARRAAEIDPRDVIADAENELQRLRDVARAAPVGTEDRDRADRAVAEQELELRRLNREKVDAIARAGIDPRDTLADAREAIRAAERAVRDEMPGTAAYADAQRRLVEARQRHAAEQNAVAEAYRGALRDPASQLQSAWDNVRTATQRLDDEKAGTRGFYEALAAYNQARYEYGEELANARATQRLLDIDLTDPVANAVEETYNARQAWRRAVAAGRRPDVVDPLRVEYERAMHSEERVRFDERMRAAQTANELGRMSDQAYLAYLNDEAMRLRAIVDRTYQQQAMLDEVDRAIKGATDALSGGGMWNIGDIDVPTPYEVRRSIEAQTAGIGYSVNEPKVTNYTTNVSVNGADLVQVKQLLTSLLGPQSSGRVTTARRT